jgi:hypothetical protein
MSTRKRISATIPTKLLELAKKHEINRSYALAVGMRHLLTKNGVKDEEGVIDITCDKTYGELAQKVRVLTSRLETISRTQYLQELKLRGEK